MSKKREEKKVKTIEKRIIKYSVGIVSGFLIFLGGASSIANYQSTVSSLEQTMVETVEIAAKSLNNDLQTYLALANEISYNPLFRSSSAAKEEIAAECSRLAERNQLIDMDITDAEGNSKNADYSVKDMDYFQKAKETGKPYISDPVYRDDIDTMNIIIAAPIMEDNTFLGVVYMGLDASFLCDMVKSIDIGETGNASLINAKGDTIGYQDVELVKSAYNTQEDLKNDKQLEQLAAVERKVMAGETGFDSYSYGGVEKYAAYAPVPGTNGWGLYIAVARSEFLRSTYLGIAVVIVILLAAIALASVLMKRLAVSIVSPIKLCVERIKKLSQGDLQSEVPRIETGDETQVLADNMKILIGNMKGVIGDIDYCLAEMSGGNFTVDSRVEEDYVGDFENILVSIRMLNKTLNNAMGQISEVAGQVAAGSEHMAENAQSLAEGTTEQAGAVEELTATISNVASMAEESAVTTDKAYRDAKESSEMAEGSRKDIGMLTEAMERISSTSKEIENIIETIEDIASQTNLLSLNASIEAARAGEAGKGFAVVADQIGKLASDSAQSAVMTRELISKSLEEIQRGNEITLKTAESLKEVIGRMHQFAEVAFETNKTSKSQADIIQEVEQGIEQIAGVVQDNSAAAQETSATSEELSAQSDNLKTLVERFRLKSDEP